MFIALAVEDGMGLREQLALHPTIFLHADGLRIVHLDGASVYAPVCA